MKYFFSKEYRYFKYQPASKYKVLLKVCYLVVESEICHSIHVYFKRTKFNAVVLLRFLLVSISLSPFFLPVFIYISLCSFEADFQLR